MFLLAKWLHVLFVIAWLGGGTVLLVLNARVRGGDPAFARAFAARVAPLGQIYFAPLGGLTLLTGLWAVAAGDYSFTAPFVLVGYAGIVLGAVLGARGSGGTTEAIANAASDAEVPALQRRLLLFSTLDVTLLTLVVAAMVFKPG